MFKKRSLMPGGSKQSKRKKIEHCKENFGLESPHTNITNVPLTKQRNMMGYMQTSDAQLMKAKGCDTNDECASSRESDDEAKFTLSVNDDVTKEDILNTESKLVDVNANDTKSSGSSARFEMKNRPSQASKQIRQPSNIRTTMLTDYQPDVCKDYRQTGYCGYGDSCKFLHSRDDFKAGWHLNQEWKIEINSEKPDVMADLKNVPPNCSICKEDYKSPVVTSCGHYFCSKCFTKRVRETPKCVICGQDTQGVAKMATHLKRNLTKQSLQ